MVGHQYQKIQKKYIEISYWSFVHSKENKEGGKTTTWAALFRWPFSQQKQEWLKSITSYGCGLWRAPLESSYLRLKNIRWALLALLHSWSQPPLPSRAATIRSYEYRYYKFYSTTVCLSWSFVMQIISSDMVSSIRVWQHSLWNYYWYCIGSKKLTPE